VRPTPWFLSLILLLAACSSSPGGSEAAPSSGGAPSQPGASGAGEATPGTALTACDLVAPADIEAALSLDPGTVSEGTFKETPTVLDPASSECRYTDESWGGLVVTLTPTDGANTFDAVRDTFGKDAETIDDVGDGALWFQDNDRGYFLKGTVMVILQFQFIVDGTPFREPTIALGETLVAKI
jgi:hypothetical protein